MASGGPGGILPQDCHRGLRQEQGSNFFFFFFGRQSSSQGLGEVLSVSKCQLSVFKRKS